MPARIIVEPMSRSLPTSVPYRSERITSFRIEDDVFPDDEPKTDAEILKRVAGWRFLQLHDLDAQEALLRERYDMPTPDKPGKRDQRIAAARAARQAAPGDGPSFGYPMDDPSARLDAIQKVKEAAEKCLANGTWPPGSTYEIYHREYADHRASVTARPDRGQALPDFMTADRLPLPATPPAPSSGLGGKPPTPAGTAASSGNDAAPRPGTVQAREIGARTTPPPSAMAPVGEGTKDELRAVADQLIALGPDAYPDGVPASEADAQETLQRNRARLYDAKNKPKAPAVAAAAPAAAEDSMPIAEVRQELRRVALRLQELGRPVNSATPKTDAEARTLLKAMRRSLADAEGHQIPPASRPAGAAPPRPVKPDGSTFPLARELKPGDLRCSHRDHSVREPRPISAREWDASHAAYGFALCDPHMAKERTKKGGR